MNSLPSSEPLLPQMRSGPALPASNHAPRSRRDPDPVTDAIRNRLRRVLMRYSARQIAQATGHNHETVRRYLLAGILPADFLHAVCVVYGVCPRYLLLGVGSALVPSNASAASIGEDSGSLPTTPPSVSQVIVARASSKGSQKVAGC